MIFLRKDFLVDSSYSISFCVRFLSIAVTCFSFYYFSKIIPGKGNVYLSIYTQEYFPFILTGLMGVSFFNACIGGFVSTFLREQGTGILESLLTAPISLARLTASMMFYNLLMGLTATLFYVFLGVVFFKASLMIHIASVGIIIFLSMMCFLPMGLIVTATLITFKRGDPLTWLLSSLFWILGGLYYPISIFPSFLQTIASWLPSTYVLKALRLALLKGYSPSMLKEELVILTIFAGALSLAGIWIFHRAIRWSQKTGSIILP